MKTLTDITVTLRPELFGGRSFSKATLYQPPATLDTEHPGASEPVSLKIAPAEHGISIAIPSLGLWGIVKLEN